VTRRAGDAAAKAAAVRQWTADPCGPETTAEPGTAAYAEQLVAGRSAYAPWLAEALDYRGASGLKVLDVGCGQGIDAIEYARAGADLTGIDLTPRHVELARRNLEALGLEADIVEGDGEQLPFADETFDRVSSNGVLHHTPDIDAALREIHRVLKPGGEARIILYNRNSLHYWLVQVLWQGLRHRQLLEERSMGAVARRRTLLDRRAAVGARVLAQTGACPHAPGRFRRHPGIRARLQRG
jgi:SAM-dependent methyltransferase